MRRYFVSQLKFFVVIGLVFWAFGAKVFYKETMVYSKWDVVEGQVLDVKRYTKTKKGKDKPVYDFSVSYSYNGEDQIVKKTAFSGIPNFKVGDSYLVSINPLNPEETRVTAGSAMGLILVTLVVGATALLIGLFGFFLDRKKKA